MKKVVASVLAFGSLVAAGSAFAGLPAATGVVGSLHDMTRVVPGTADAMGRVCVYCHAPHHSLVTDGTSLQGALPLWNHQLSTANFTPYTWATPDNQAAVGSITDPLVGPSRLCMSCHDGNVAIDEHGVASNSTWKQAGGTFMSSVEGGRANLSADLSNTHPIGFDYNAMANARNKAVVSGQGTNGSEAGQEIVTSNNHYADSITISTDLNGAYNTVSRNQGNKTIADNLYGGNIMTCATCHEVHNKENAVQDAFNGNNGSSTTTKPNYFLYAKENNSLICLSCHIK